MAFNMNKLKTLPLNIQIAIAVVPSVLLIALFIFLIFMPKNKEMDALKDRLVKLDNEIISSETKVKRLDALIVENKILRERLHKLKEQLPEEKEVSVLLKQISELGLRSGLDILLWKPEGRSADPQGLYIEIPVSVKVVTGYHQLGDFLSHISRLSRLVNITDLNLKIGNGVNAGVIDTDFRARTFASTEANIIPGDKK